ncbi:Excinuclease ABC subunit C [uncultured Gammaproteobacteria bacterium]|jgi:excinuclease ABC subunit C|uniref:excinuclease ABC subunit UvrC n=1 Tax=thiotrophic endosymbiont of Bathymodiolus puteoserpentis (Logatchev) TaxID=343240 RepID=UPI0010B4ADA9|nr:excinuclease ABC subunit UvrC [thiotrophic endosymbiont of Bathymodiolus puteoserpentis (Logatchev)]CAC9579063.1 Excinuclease ABC subunit C [uncultured Gammaproteobacteria bacterium]CAC9634860.1 Excinuclease ABC subunit C [uncultured Gammaproteobacteria bacterium]CAC9640327.1 Excinuclease ABC subunit C [uncultured Gammaproteobacteria bacterium]CAC9656573.1 Excinuclease ABC subunit C [uncultured Gammaproteobacteria bacterium]CAC9983832.1 Excinuclease ABC subunit C [uncultured Gammaproteobact
MTPEKLKNLTTQPGVYQMLDKQGMVIYVGKAKNLKKRVSSYFSKTHQDDKTRVLVTNIDDFDVVITNTETQALLLENELIKQHKPRYNILLKDAKSYPYIYITNDKHPRVGFYRGTKHKNYQFFGPYPSAHVVRDSLNLLKKIFKVRQCTNATYRSRSRPCLEYQIALCSAPCVNKISDKDYAQDVKMMSLFLSGKGVQTLDNISQKMQAAAKNQEFELAAHLRDQMIALRTIQEQHSSQSMGNIDVISIAMQDGIHAVEVLFVRSGKQIGQECVFPKHTKGKDNKEVLSAFLPLYYLGKDTPAQLLLSEKLLDKKLIAQALSTKIIDTPQKDKRHFLKIADLTAKENLKQHLASKYTKRTQLKQLQTTLNLKSLPNTMECFDISHTMGEATTASCVVFEKGLPKIKKYRQFDIKNITPGDDYAAMNQAVFRRYSRLLKDKKPLPDIVFIDGGLGQLNQAIMVMDSIGVESIQLVGVAKGEGRKAGLETLILVKEGKTQKINLPPHDQALMLINHIRDESHRFAIKNHRQKRGKKRTTSALEGIEGVGKARRAALLNHFGGLQELKQASVEEMQKVNGISLTLATKITKTLKQ